MKDRRQNGRRVRRSSRGADESAVRQVSKCRLIPPIASGIASISIHVRKQQTGVGNAYDVMAAIVSYALTISMPIRNVRKDGCVTDGPVLENAADLK